MKPRVGISLGDPLGIGAEVVVAALTATGLRDVVEPVIFGDEALLTPPYVATCDEKAAAHRGASALKAATDALLTHDIDALATAPIHKAALMALPGGPFRGQTGYLAHRFRGAPLMAFAGEQLRVALLTVHVPISEVSSYMMDIGTSGVVRRVRCFAEGLEHDLGVASPRIALLGLNPHAGESGLLGTEDRSLLQPAVDELQQSGIDVSGPFPADGLFGALARGTASYDGVMACYHDQGLVGFKSLEPRCGVQISFGLSGVRTSCFHGTARDIAGKGQADSASMEAAIRLAGAIAQRRGKTP